MKNTLFSTAFATVLALAAVAAVAPTSQAQLQIKVGYVNMTKIFNEYYETEQAKNHIEESKKNAEKELKEKADGLQKYADELQKLEQDIQKPELTTEGRDKKIQERNKKLQDARVLEKGLLDMRNARLKSIQETATRMRAEIVLKIRKAIDDKVKADQYDLVLDRSGLSSNGVEIVLYSKDAADFSADIIKVLNAGRPKQ